MTSIMRRLNLMQLCNFLESRIKRRFFLHKSRRNQFEEIYSQGGFGGGGGSLSGIGSDLDNTIAIRKAMPSLFARHKISSVLDIPCGDFYWMQHVNLEDIRYIGADIVDDLVNENAKKFSSTNKIFMNLDMVKDALPEVDLILCRDCFIHMKLIDAQAAIGNFKRSGAKWLLATSFNRTSVNEEIDMSFFRPLNLCMPPFSFPPPTESIDEQCTLNGGIYSDKCLGLWRICDLP